MSFAAQLFRKIAGAPSFLNLGPRGTERLDILRPDFEAVGKETGVPPDFLAAVAWTESGFHPDAVGPDVEIKGGTHNGLGLMQVMSFHRERFGWIGPNMDAWKSPRENLRAGAVILVEDCDLGDTPIREALRCYGGFVHADEREYVDRILSRASWLGFQRLSEVLT